MPSDPCNESLSKMELDVLKFQKSLTAKKGLTALKMPTVHYDPNSSQENVNPTLSAVSQRSVIVEHLSFTDYQKQCSSPKGKSIVSIIN